MINKFYQVYYLRLRSALLSPADCHKTFCQVFGRDITGTLVPIGTGQYLLYTLVIWPIVKNGAILVGIVQSVLVVVFVLNGRQPLRLRARITLELAMLAFPHYVSTLFSSFTAGAVCNATGSFIVSVVFMRLAFIPMLVSLIVSVIFGGIGGIVGYKLYDVVNNLKGAQGNTANEKPQD